MQTPFFVALLALLLACAHGKSAITLRGGKGEDPIEASAVEGRRLNEVSYEYQMVGTYTWEEDYEFEGTNDAQAEQMVRMSNIYYRRLLAQEYSVSFQAVTADLVSVSVDEGDSRRKLKKDKKSKSSSESESESVESVPLRAVVEFTTTFTHRLVGNVPDESENGDTIRNEFDEGDYLGFLQRFLQDGNIYKE